MKLIYRYQLNTLSTPQTTSYPVKSLDEALDLANKIAKRDVDRNNWSVFDLEVTPGESWTDDYGDCFDDFLMRRGV